MLENIRIGLVICFKAFAWCAGVLYFAKEIMRYTTYIQIYIRYSASADKRK